MKERTPSHMIPDLQGRDIKTLQVPRSLYTENHPSLLHLTGALHAWQTRVHDPIDRTPQRIANRAYVEVAELDETIKGGGNEEAILDESVDGIIGLLGVALTVAEPKRVAEAVFDKLVLMLHKYDAVTIERLKREGMATDEALEEMKRRWDTGEVRTLFHTNGQTKTPISPTL